MSVLAIRLPNIRSSQNIHSKNIASYFRLLTNQIYQEAADKVPQCSKLAFPCLLAEATLHYTGAKMCFRRRSAEDLLTGTNQR